MNIYQKIIISIIIGSLWGFTMNIIFGIFLMLTAGILIKFTYFSFMIASSISAIYFTVIKKKFYKKKNLICFILIPIIIITLTFGSPYGISIRDKTIYQIIFFFIQIFIIFISIKLCLKGMGRMSFSRYFIETIFVKVLKGIGFTFFLLIILFPFYLMMMASMKTQALLLINPLDLSIDFSRGFNVLNSYVELFTVWKFGTFLINSFIVSILSIFIALLFAIPGAYAVARFKFPGKYFLTNSILLIYLIPMITLLIPLYSFFTQINLRDSLIGLIIVYPAVTIPVAIYMLQGYFKTIPDELEEAGLIDGLNRIGVIIKITLPLSLPAIASVSLFIFMVAWNEYLFAYMFLDTPELFTLPRGLNSLDGTEVPRQHLMAGSIISTVPVIIIFLWAEKYLAGGLTAGGIKG